MLLGVHEDCGKQVPVEEGGGSQGSMQHGRSAGCRWCRSLGGGLAGWVVRASQKVVVLVRGTCLRLGSGCLGSCWQGSGGHETPAPPLLLRAVAQ